MKNNILLLFSFILSLTGCQRDELGETQAGRVMHFTVDIPEPNALRSRAAIENGMINNLYVLVFDENGGFLSRHKAELESNVANYKVSNIPVSNGKQRILHFICNYDWSKFSDVGSLGKHENEIIPPLSVSEGTFAYWCRKILPDGISDKGDGEMRIDGAIALLRNVAKISIENYTQDHASPKYLSHVAFIIGDYYNSGTVAPFNPQTGSFDIGTITESPTGVIQKIDESKFSAEPKYIYEQRNSTSKTPSYMIVKGFFQEEGQPLNQKILSYYKIDNVDILGELLYDIGRNQHYIVRLNNVATPGYSSLELAASNPASNNIIASIMVQEFTSVSDGDHILRVEMTSRTFVREAEDFRIGYAYVDARTGATENADVQISLSQDEKKPVVKPGTFGFTNDNTEGIIYGTTAKPDDFEIYSADITVKKDNLQRKINLRLRTPLDFNFVAATPDQIANAVGQPVQITFEFPENVLSYAFPMKVYIHTKRLSPDVFTGGDQLSLDPSESGEYRYVYTAHQGGRHMIHFITNSPSTNETIYVEADVFNRSSVKIGSSSFRPLTNLTFTPNGANLKPKKGETVHASVTIPEGQTPPYELRFYTLKLELMEIPPEEGTSVRPMESGAGYIYTTNRTGVHTAIFRTKFNESKEYVRIGGSQFGSIGADRSCYLYSFLNTRFDPAAVPHGTGNPVALRLSIPQDYDWTINNGICDILVYTTQLSAPADNLQGLEVIADPLLGAGYKYTAHQNGGYDVSINFVTLYEQNIETVTVDADAFNSTSISTRAIYNFEAAAFNPLPKKTGTGTNITLSFTIPNNVPVSTANPLWIWIDCGNMLNYRNTISGGNLLLATGGNLNANNTTANNGYWFKATSTGNKTVRFRVRNTNNRTAPIILRSVDAQGETVDNYLFYQTKDLNL